MIDYTKLRKKIIPEPDGEDVTKLRVGVVSAVNTNGTCDVAISGVTIPGVPRLAGADVYVGASVQIISYRGSLLILGLVATDGRSGGLGLWLRGQDTSSSSAVTSATPVSLGLVTNTGDLIKDRVYELKTFGGVSGSVAGAYADLRAYRSPALTSLAEWYRFPMPATVTAYNATGSGLYFTVTANVTSVGVALYGTASTGSLTHGGTATSPRNIEVWDVGHISKFPGVPVW
jgi:hypothetical protein